MKGKFMKVSERVPEFRGIPDDHSQQRIHARYIQASCYTFDALSNSGTAFYRVSKPRIRLRYWTHTMDPVFKTRC